MIVALLTPIWEATPETGSRLRARIEKVLDWAAAAGLRAGPKPRSLEGSHGASAQHTRSQGKHHTAMPWSEVPAFMEVLRGKDSLSARALEFTVLTAARTGETIGAKWDEMDLAASVDGAGRAHEGQDRAQGAAVGSGWRSCAAWTGPAT